MTPSTASAPLTPTLSSFACVVHHVSAVVSGPGRDDGGARQCAGVYDLTSLGNSLRPGVREALNRFPKTVLAHGESTRRAFRLSQSGTSYISPSISMKRRSTSCFAATEALRPHKRSFARPSHRTGQSGIVSGLGGSPFRAYRAKVTLDGHEPSRRALWLLRREHPCWRKVKARTNKYLKTSSNETTAPSSDATRRWPDPSC